MNDERQEITRRLDFEDAYRTEFEATVIQATTHEGKRAVVLDQTCFYPESGGQPPDRGLIQAVRVLDVQEAGGKILHVLEAEVAPGRVKGKIDWPRRFDHMQQHTGQHILSQSFVEVLAGETLSFHLGDAASTVEIGLSAISDEDAARVEGRANQILFEDREVKAYFVEERAIEGVPLRKPPKKHGSIRVIEVAGFDYSACGGTHCRRTGEIGLIKIIRWDKIRNNLRFEFLCGGRALRDYSMRTSVLRNLSRQLTVGEEGLPGAVEKLLQENRSAKKELRKIQETLAGYEAAEIIGQNPGRVISRLLSDRPAEGVKLLVLRLIRAKECAAAIALREAGQDRLFCGRSDSLNINLRELVPLVFSMAKGKGGGSPSFIELVLEKGADLQAVLTRVSEWLAGKF